jgi:hypothetical protein
MRLPRPLLLVVMVLVVLALAGSCAAFVAPAGGPGDIRSGITDFLEGLAPDPPPVVLDSSSAPCLSGDQLVIPANTACLVVVQPTDDLRRRLALRVTAGSVRFAVDQIANGKSTGTQDQTVNAGDDPVSLAVSRRDSATLGLTCLSVATCVLAVNPP